MTMYVNGRDVAAFGLTLVRDNFKGWIDYPEVEHVGVAMVGTHGEVLTATGLRTKPRVLDCTFQLKSTTLAARRSQLSGIYREFAAPVEISFLDDPNRYVVGKMVQSPGRGVGGPELVDPDVLVPMRFIAADPLYYERTPFQKALQVGFRVHIPMGTAGALVDVYLWGWTSASATIRVRHGVTGVILNDMVLTGIPSSTEYIRLFMNRQLIKRYSGTPAVETDSYSWKGSTNAWPVLDPSDGLPTIEIVSGATNGVGLLLGRKAHY